MAKVSILMPAYNAEKYIEDAINSVLNQTYGDWELIIVDDCSQDSTLAICKKIAQKDYRVRVFHMEQNGGISKTKNEALKHATGEYIAFCDDDDLLEPNTFFDNVKLADIYQAEIVRWSYKTIKVDEQEQICKVLDCKCENGLYLNRKDIFDNYCNVHTMLSCDWTGLYRKSFLDKYSIRFCEAFKFGGEDTLFNLDTLEYVNCMIMNADSYYNWYLRKNHSTTAKRNINFCDSMMEVAKRELSLIEKNCVKNRELGSRYMDFYKKLILDYARKLSMDEFYMVEVKIERFP